MKGDGGKGSNGYYAEIHGGPHPSHYGPGGPLHPPPGAPSWGGGPPPPPGTAIYAPAGAPPPPLPLDVNLICSPTDKP